MGYDDPYAGSYNEVSTRHDMNYPILVLKIMNFPKAEPLFGT